MTYVVQFWLDGDVLIDETIHEENEPLPDEADVIEFAHDGAWYSVRSVDVQFGSRGERSLVLVVVDDF